MDTKKLQEAENDSTYSNEQRQLYKDRLDDLNTEKKGKIRIKQTLQKVLDKDTSLAEIIHTLFCEQGVTIFSILTGLSMIISTIVLPLQVFLEEAAEGHEVYHQQIKGC